MTTAKKLLKFLTVNSIAIASIFNSLPTQAAWQKQYEWHPKDVVDLMYAEIQIIHNYQYTPNLVWDVMEGSSGGCGEILGSQYCSRNHTIYITHNHIKMAYEHGDAALAYIISHEYAHAMQTAYGFMPNRVLVAELQADCLAGVYFGTIPNIEFDPKDIVEASTLAYRIGDFEFYSRDHHGKPQQRYEAISLGMNASASRSGVQACINYYR